MKFTILTLFPAMFSSVFDYSIVKRAQTKNLIKIALVNLRDFATDKYGTVDDRPYGGGAGMILKVDVIDRALTHIKKDTPRPDQIILLDPKGTPYDQEIARKLSHYQHMVLICGHYEGVDARVDNLVDRKITIGNYILTGGEIPAMVIVDSVTRLLPGVLTKPHVVLEESFTKNLLEPPQYTRPPKYKNMKVPEVLLSGNHRQINEWKKIHALPVDKSRRK